MHPVVRQQRFRRANGRPPPRPAGLLRQPLFKHGRRTNPCATPRRRDLVSDRGIPAFWPPPAGGTACVKPKSVGRAEGRWNTPPRMGRACVAKKFAGTFLQGRRLSAKLLADGVLAGKAVCGTMSDPLQLSKRERQIMEVIYARREASVNQLLGELPGPVSGQAVRTFYAFSKPRGTWCIGRWAKRTCTSPRAHAGRWPRERCVVAPDNPRRYW